MPNLPTDVLVGTRGNPWEQIKKVVQLKKIWYALKTGVKKSVELDVISAIVLKFQTILLKMIYFSYFYDSDVKYSYIFSYF